MGRDHGLATDNFLGMQKVPISIRVARSYLAGHRGIKAAIWDNCMCTLCTCTMRMLPGNDDITLLMLGGNALVFGLWYFHPQ